ncbi:MAG: sigma-70 family RNA polymerase sigma factor [Terracidiphilus sp.]
MSESPSNPPAEPQRSLDGDATHRGSQDEAVHDELLLTRAKGGDKQAMTELFDRYSGMVYSVALRVLNDPGQAEDVMQEIFFQVWRNPHAFVAGRGSLGAWLAVMARNRAIDSLRRRRPTDSVDNVVLASSSDLGSELERNQMMEKVREILKGLPLEQQKSVELAFFEGLTHSEIATRTGDPLGTVKTRIRSALMTLRKAMSA